MTHPLFRSEIFVETAFEKRFQAMLRLAWHKRSWHVIVADPGAGKTMGIRDLLKTAGSRTILAVTTPKNNEEEQALGDQLFTALGLKLTGQWRTRKPKLMGHLNQCGTQCLVVDDAHDLSLEHLLFLKELTDQGKLQYDHPLGLCLVAAGRGDTIPLKETLDQPEMTWLQWRRRLDKVEPFCRIASHTSEEVREILVALEKVYQPLFPQLNLRQWTSSIYTWLTHSVLDPTNSGRVTMDYLMKLVTTALEWSYEAKAPDVRAETLEKAAQLLVLRRDTFRIIDGAGPSLDAPPSEDAKPGNGAGWNQNRKRCKPGGSRTRRKREERWKNRCKRALHPHARFLGWFPSISNVLPRVPCLWLNVLTVAGPVRSLHTRACFGLSLTTNAKSPPPIPCLDGSRDKRTGTLLGQKDQRSRARSKMTVIATLIGSILFLWGKRELKMK